MSTTRQLFVNDIRATRARTDGGLTNADFLMSIGHISEDAVLNGVSLTEYARPQDLEFVYQELWTHPRCGVASVNINEDGKAVIITPALVNAEGFDITVIASDNVDGTGNIGAIPLNASGRTVINEEKGEARFFRLGANATE